MGKKERRDVEKANTVRLIVLVKAVENLSIEITEIKEKLKIKENTSLEDRIVGLERRNPTSYRPIQFNNETI